MARICSTICLPVEKGAYPDIVDDPRRFRDWLDAHNEKVGGHTPHGGFDMDNGMILDKAWLKA